MGSEEDKQKAHDLIAEYADFNNMGQLRSAIATAITAARAETWKEAIEIAKARDKFWEEHRASETSERGKLKSKWRAMGANSVVIALEAAAGSKTKVFEDEQKNQGR